MTMTTENRIFIVVQWIVLLVFFATLITWASVVIPATLICFFALWLILFAIGRFARAIVRAIRWCRKLVGKD